MWTQYIWPHATAISVYYHFRDRHENDSVGQG